VSDQICGVISPLHLGFRHFENAQCRRFRHITALALLSPDHFIRDIGCAFLVSTVSLLWFAKFSACMASRTCKGLIPRAPRFSIYGMQWLGGWNTLGEGKNLGAGPFDLEGSGF